MRGKIIPGIFLALALIPFKGLNAQTNCQCWQPRDTAFHYVPFNACTSECGQQNPPYYRDDDGATDVIILPFQFCFYGKSTDSVYINTNGNITIGSLGASFTTFTPDTFPQPANNVPPMLAPFWGDVDLVGGAGGVHDVILYKITQHYMIVQWDSVGYFDTHTNKLNSFQVIMTDGTDPIIPSGSNVEFCYKQMQWTTGDASGGTNGFGVHPATVGANKGDGVNYIQFGLFDNPTANYAGQYPAAPYDGVAWLDNKSFFFNSCANNLPPIVEGVSPCDTFILCLGDTVRQIIDFLSPTASDSTYSALQPPVLPGVSIISNHPGRTDSVTLQMYANTSNYGIHTVTLYAYDNQVPPDTTFINFVLEVDSNAVGNLVLSPDSICPGDSAKLKIVNLNTHNIHWSTGADSIDSIYVKPLLTTTYSVTLIKGRCSPLTLTQTVPVKLVPSIAIAKDSLCPGDSDVVTVTDGYSYLWNTGSTDSAVRVKVDTSTTYICTSTGAFCGAQHLSKRAKVIPLPVIGLSGPTTICDRDSTILTASGGTHYLWNDGATTSGYNPVKFKPAATKTYTLTAYNSLLCTSDTVFTITVNPVPHVQITGPAEICSGAGATLHATGGGAYLWSTNATSASIPVTPSVKTTYKVVVDSNGCKDSASATILVDVPKLTQCCNDTIKKGDTVQLTADSSSTYSWNPLTGLSCFVCPNPIADPSVTTTYTVTGTDTAGCPLSKTVTVDVYIPCGDFVVPTVFTPNNDGINDDLVIAAVSTTSYSINIFDRWGKPVYYSVDPNAYWNGRINNTENLAPDGVYYYVIKAGCGPNTYNKKGFVELLGEK
jgi:gliding motility-associated-like protein